MGITYEDARVLCDAALAGVSFHRTLTLGHLRSHLNKKELREFARELRTEVPADLLLPEPYADSFFTGLLGAASLTSLDASAFEGASMIHDLNRRIPEPAEQTFDAVIDSGTLEHVFHFPVALANCMRLLRTGGRLWVFTNANNFMGHGFYQFSPELFYRTLDERTGFAIERMLLVEYKFIGAEFGSRRPWYSVADPDHLRTRGMVVNDRPLGLLLQARKNSHVSDPFGEPPEQSDYARLWTAERGGAPEEPSRGFSEFLRHRFPQALRVPINRVRTYLSNRREGRSVFSLRNRAHFLPVDPRDAARLSRDSAPRPIRGKTRKI
jgi:SAM-dependent methyltransferase